jgi:hypothetical protein
LFDSALTKRYPTNSPQKVRKFWAAVSVNVTIFGDFVENQSYDPFWAVVNVTITTYFWRFLLKTKVMIHFVIK